jgi:hypothetical protein
MSESCKCWASIPPLPHDGHCCFDGNPDEYALGTTPCGHNDLAEEQA